MLLLCYLPPPPLSLVHCCRLTVVVAGSGVAAAVGIFSFSFFFRVSVLCPYFFVVSFDFDCFCFLLSLFPVARFPLHSGNMHKFEAGEGEL